MRHWHGRRHAFSDYTHNDERECVADDKLERTREDHSEASAEVVYPLQAKLTHGRLVAPSHEDCRRGQ